MAQTTAAATLDPILSLCVCGCLPLHIAGCVGTATRQRHDVINNMASPAASVTGLSLEGALWEAASL
jgi:hypothetical protein